MLKKFDFKQTYETNIYEILKITPKARNWSEICNIKVKFHLALDTYLGCTKSTRHG